MGTRRSRSSFASARRGFGDVGRVMTRGQGHTPPVTLRKIGGGHCEELVLRQKHSCHVILEAHLTGVRRWVGNGEVQMGAEMRKCRGKGKFSGSRVCGCISVQSAARAKAALTCSEDETVARGFSLSQCPTSASSSTSLTAVLSDLHTPWSHSLSCWLPLLIDAGAGSCR